MLQRISNSNNWNWLYDSSAKVSGPFLVTRLKGHSGLWFIGTKPYASQKVNG